MKPIVPRRMRRVPAQGWAQIWAGGLGRRFFASLSLSMFLFGDWLGAYSNAMAQSGASAPASQPAATRGQPGGKASDLRATITVAYRFGDKELTVEEFWHLSNPTMKSVAASEVMVPLPSHVRFAVVDESTPGFKAAEDSRSILATSGIQAGGQAQFGTRYLQRFSGGELDVSRKVPFAVDAVRVIVEYAPAVKLRALEPVSQRRETEMGDIRFSIFELGPKGPGAEFGYTIAGLPSHSVWPKYAAALACLGILVWMGTALLKQRMLSETSHDGPLSPAARRDQILKAIEVLNRDYSANKVKEKRYERRYSELLTALAATLREAELAKIRAKGRVGAR